MLYSGEGDRKNAIFIPWFWSIGTETALSYWGTKKTESEKNTITFRRRYHKKNHVTFFVPNILGRNFESYNKETEHKKEMIIWLCWNLQTYLGCWTVGYSWDSPGTAIHSLWRAAILKITPGNIVFFAILYKYYIYIYIFFLEGRNCHCRLALVMVFK